MASEAERQRGAREHYNLGNNNMWYEIFDRKESVKNIVPEGISLLGGRIDYIILCSGKKVAIDIILLNLPDSIPEKWREKMHDAVSITLEFTGVESYKASANDIVTLTEFVAVKRGSELGSFLARGCDFEVGFSFRSAGIMRVYPFKKESWA